MSILSSRSLLFPFVLLLSLLVGGCVGTETQRSTGEFIDDATITTKVNAKLADDPSTSVLRINVDTYRGNVQLSGFVESRDEKARAEELTREVEGVRDVANNLEVKPKGE
ncbi:BON domain-containing protein [Sedimenticola hydrogenitrophicus]|uniref:BON domain-containing protein n=1 Tax=Sedimenticola hydrogenitrophicus TaxID=2967975 RepID=UPI0021A771F3|nr:BON domain-containing protein [Sedimenticola hydrogenitrophicus]